MNPFVIKWSIKRILKKGRLAGCLLLIALVMAPLVCALIFADSMMEGITSKYIYLSDGHVQVEYDADDSNRFDASGLQNMIESVDEVTSGYALMYSASSTSNVKIKGVADSYFNERRLNQITFITEELPESNLNGISISRTTAKALDVKVGDKVALMIVPDDSNKVLRPIIVRIESIFYSGYDQLDQLLAFISIEYAKTLFSDPSSTSMEILVTPEYMETLDMVVEAIGSDYEVSTWDQHNVSVYENFVTSRQMILVILMLVVFVAAFYTASVAQQMVQDDIHDIAISKLIGASDSKVRNSAFLSVYFVTIAGIIVGISLGLLIGTNLGPLLNWLSGLGIDSLSFYLLDFKTNIPWPYILMISACLMMISFVSILISLRKTRHITPIRLFTSF